MRTYLECIPCFLRQAYDSARRSSSNAADHETVVRQVLRATAAMDFNTPPPVMGQQIHRLIRRVTGDADPYRELKDRSNRFAQELYPVLLQRVFECEDPLEAALRLAATGNMIDLGAKSRVSDTEVRAAMEQSLTEPLDAGTLSELRREAGSARRILYIGDNAGEIVLDRLAVQQLGPWKVTFAVRGAPVINDATLEDAVTSGMADMVDVVDSGSDAPGTVLEDCSPAFRKLFAEADVVLAKGQGNYETLNATERRVFFLLRIKCRVLARDIGLPMERLVLTARGAGAATGRSGH